MITREAVSRTISDLLSCGDPINDYIANAFEALVKHQDEIEEEDEQRHDEIMNTINPLGQD